MSIGHGTRRRRGPLMREVIREAWRNVVGNATRAGLWLLVFTCLVGALSWADTAQIVGLQNQASAFVGSGGATWVLRASGEIDGVTCEALSRATGVVAAGALRRSDVSLVLANLPGAPLPQYNVTAGFSSVVGTPEVSGVIIPESVAGEIGAGSGSTLTSTSGAVSITGTYAFPDDGRDPALEYAALSLVPTTGLFDQCWMVVWPVNQATINLLYLTLAGQSQGADPAQVQMAQLNPTLSARFDAHLLFLSRLTRWCPVAALVIGLAAGYLSLAGRRLEMASSLHAGWPHWALLWQATFETAVWVAGGAVIGIGPCLWEARQSVSEALPIALVGARSLAAGIVGALLGAGLGVASVRERHLFRLFKQR